MLRVAFITTDGRDLGKDYSSQAPDFGTAPQALLQGFAGLPDVEVHVVSCLRKPVASPEKLAPNIFYHSVIVPKIGWMTTGYQGCIRAVRNKMKAIRPDIVHGQGTERDCAVCAAFSGFPNVVTIHGNMRRIAKANDAPAFSYNRLNACLEAFTIPRTNGVLCNSVYTQGLVAPLAKKTWLVPNAVRPEFFDTLKTAAAPRPPVLLNIGVVTAYKRQVELLALAGKLHRRGLRFQLCFIGPSSVADSYGAIFHRELKAAEAAGCTAYLGSMNSADLIRRMDEASALVHVPGEESFGLVVAEALARNLKFFGFKVGGVADITAGVEGAETMEDGRWDDLENAIASWLEAGASRLSGADEVMRLRYHPRVVAERHLSIYREVLGKSS